ncbi:hypothetical protein CR205_09235 [Alteribacter lacisalsi]|uniref:histidine kinase n=1 Tax=Alteribacter lacisalsi TaxID=2045244 RepID=A0A2W0HPD3_9BACI|nr:ATP-binding protein [Alteribacter lacisalsi]PYZ98739.1 hypothetical protein CR205_09235 [Alteribacter lacisalsi]
MGWILFYKKAFVITLMIISAAAAFLMILLNLQYPYIGLEVQKQDHGEYEAGTVSTIGWAHANQIQPGDQILEVNGNPVEEHSTVQDYSRVEKAESVTVLSEGAVRTEPVTMSRYFTEEHLYFVVFPSFFFFLSLWLSLLLLKSTIKPHTSMLILFIMTLSLCYHSAGLAAKLSQTGLYIQTVTFLLSPVLFLQFVYHYFMTYKESWLNKNWMKGAYLLLFVLLLLNTALSVALASTGRMILLISFLLLLFYIFSALTKGIVNFRREPVLNTFKMLFISLVIALAPFTFLYVLPVLFTGSYLLPGEAVSIFIFVVPVIFLYLLCTDQLVNIQLYFSRLGYYLGISALPPVLVIIFFPALSNAPLTLSLTLQVFSVTYLTTLLFLYLKSYLDAKLRKSLFLGKEQFKESIYRLTMRMRQNKSVEEVQESIEKEFQEVLNVDRTVHFFISKRNHTVSEMESSKDDFDLMQLISILKRSPVSTGAIFQSGSSFALIIGESSEYYYVTAGLNDKPFRLDDSKKEWLLTLSYYSSILLENLLRIEDLLQELEDMTLEKEGNTEWLTRLLFNLSEKERSQLSVDLHDSVLQELLVLKREVSEIKSATDMGTAINSARLEKLEEGLLDVIYLTRETCHSLLPPLLESNGLEGALDDLASKFQLRSNIKLSLTATGLKRDTDYEVTLALYRIVQELLNNAMKHSNAENVSVSLRQQHGTITLEYNDNGMGISSLNEQTVGKMGLFGIKERVNSLKGKISIVTEKNEGLTVTIRLEV